MTSSIQTAVGYLLEREVRQTSNSNTPEGVNFSGCGLTTRLNLNAVWRQKVVHWYFTLVAALRRQHFTAVETSSSRTDNPFSRASVHAAVHFLDNYLMSLPSERALRYKRDRPAYQLLATTCLLLGMRLTQLDQIKEKEARKEETAGHHTLGEDLQGGLKRAKTHRTNMNEVSAPTVARTTSAGVAIPNAAAILRISAAPESMSEHDILFMVREMTGSASFPRSKVVTALHFIDALCGISTHASEDSPISLGPADTEDACRLTDATLRDTRFSGLRPSVLACAVVTHTLARSYSVNLSLAFLRRKVYHSIFGTEDDPLLQASVRKAESNLLGSIQVGAPPSRNRHAVPTTHLIPLEDE